jgi:hypothetical protein
LALANLDFEYELAQGTGSRKKGRGLDSCWLSILRLLPEARRAEVLAHEVLANPLLAKGLTAERLVVWGVTPRVAKLAELLGLPHAFPPVAVVREVNDKRFSHALEHQLGIALPFSKIVSSVDQLKASVKDCPFDWVLKHPLGFSALQRVVGRRGKITDSALGWTRNQVAEGWTLLFEPWVEASRNFSMHFEVSETGETRFLGHCELLTDLGGVYRGNRVTGTRLDPTIYDRGLEVTSEVARRGYWGPVGIDAFTGQLGGHPVLRPLVEINARCSFGRLTLALADWTPPGWCYHWWHPRKADCWRVDGTSFPLPEPGEAGLEPGAYALPLSVDPGQRSRTLILLASTLAKLEQIEEEWISSPA